jgi:hypothetical protein
MSIAENHKLQSDFIERLVLEVHGMWHAGATVAEVRTRVTDRIHADWWNKGGRSKPPLRIRRGYRMCRWQVLREAYGPKACGELSETGGER